MPLDTINSKLIHENSLRDLLNPTEMDTTSKQPEWYVQEYIFTSLAMIAEASEGTFSKVRSLIV